MARLRKHGKKLNRWLNLGDFPSGRALQAQSRIAAFMHVAKRRKRDARANEVEEQSPVPRSAGHPIHSSKPDAPPSCAASRVHDENPHGDKFPSSAQPYWCWK